MILNILLHLLLTCTVSEARMEVSLTFGLLLASVF